MWTKFLICLVIFKTLVEALEQNELVQLIYQGGSHKGQKRTVKPFGIVRNPEEGDFFVAQSEEDERSKRFYLNKISAANL